MIDTLSSKFKKLFAPLPDAPNDKSSREMWPSRAAFLLASIGSSVGLGNIWRFPALAYKFGGGAFFLPYLLALFFIGIPMLALELSLGKMYRSGDVVSFSRVSHRLRGLGIASVFGAFVVSSYYAVLMAWIVVYFFRSFQAVLPWTVKDPDLYFTEDILMLPSDGRTENPIFIIGHCFGALMFVWVLIYFCLWKGMTLVGKITYVTMTLPIFLVIVLFFRGVTLPGAGDGIRDYIGQFDSSKLSDPLMWSEAVGQIFFSIGIAFGTMTAYASYNSKHQNTAVDSVIIALSNSVYEIFCGFVVFSVVGYLRGVTGDRNVAVGSFGLAFATYPVAFSTLPGAQFWCALFFLTLFTLGIDSGFSLVEAAVTCILDSRLFKGYKRENVVGVVCLSAFAIGILFTTEVGLYALDAADYFLNNIAIILVGLLECLGAGYLYRFKEVSKNVGLRSILFFDFSVLVGLVVGVSVATVEIWIGLVVGLAFILFGLMFAILFADPALSRNDRLWWITMGNVELLRRDINGTDTKGKTRLPLFWSVTIKFICVPALFLVLTVPFTQIAAQNPGVPMAYRWLGICIASITIFIVIFGAVMPRWLEWALPLDEDSEEQERKHEIDLAIGDDSELELYIAETVNVVNV